MPRRSLLWVAFLMACTLNGTALLAQGQGNGGGNGSGGITPMAGQCGEPENPCEPEPQLTLISGPVPRPVESGPFTYTVRVKNSGDAAGAFILWCESSSPQVSCSVSPTSIPNLKVNFTADVTVTYSTLGIGSFSHTIFAEAEPNADQLVVTPVQVTGASMLNHLAPVDSGATTIYDLLQATANHPSGIVAGSMKVKVNNGSWATYPTQVGGTAQDSVARHSLSPGWHTWRSSACATNGRCDSLATQFTFSGPAASWALDDSLPDPGIAAGMTGGLLIGALPVPPAGLKGCPEEPDDPEIRLLGPGTYLSQPANQTTPTGILYRASVTAGTHLRITTLTVDHTPTQGSTCANWSFLDPGQYDENFWLDAPDIEGLWTGYPYGDLALGEPAFPDTWDRLELAALPEDLPKGGPNPWNPASRRASEAVAATRLGPLTARLARVLLPRVAIPDPGAIDTASYRITVNGRVLLTETYRHPKLSIVSLKRIGAKWDLEVHDSLLNRWTPTGSPPNGGWNEVVVSVADSFGNRTSVRSRWVQSADGGTPEPLLLSSLRRFEHRHTGECAAFGAIQCDEVFVAQGLPGFVTRDKDRGLSLVYRSGSQRAGTIVPVGILIGRFRAKPDSLRAWASVSGVTTGPTYHFAGKAGGPPGANLMEDGAIEERTAGVLLPTPSAGALALRRVRINVTSRYGATSITDTLSQDVVSLHLSDTVSTRFGQGWTIGQLSRLHLDSAAAANPAIVWEQGDGSHLLFRKVSGTWQPVTPSAVYLIDKVAAPDDGASWLLTLSNGARMGFSATGRQAWTADLIGNKTRFHWKLTAPTVLDSIVDPAGPRYIFVYNALKVNGSAAPGQVGDIRMRHGSGLRTIATLSYDASGARLRKIVLRPDASTQDSTVFEYDTGLSSKGAFLTAVHDPRSTVSKPIVTRFVYDSMTGLPMHVQPPADQYGVGQTKYRSPWRRAVPRVGYGGPSTLERLVFQTQLIGTHVPVQGQTLDVTVDRFGGLTRVRRIAPAQIPTFPFTLVADDDVVEIDRDSLTGLVRKVVRGRMDPMYADSAMYWYDALGRLDSTRMASPRTDVASATELLKFRYDVAVPSGTIAGGAPWCSRLLWTQGVAGGADTTRMNYGASGTGKCLPLTIRDPAGGVTTYTYGSLTPGTPSATRPSGVTDPAGINVTAGFDASTWNTRTVTRTAIAATETTHYGAFGLVDSVVSAEGHLTRFLHDSLGRTTHTVGGRGATVPVTRSVFGPGGLVREVQVYAAPSAEPELPEGAVQVTKYFHDVHGGLDSLVHPGTRVGKVARRQSWRRDRAGNPIWEFPGNGAYVTRTYDHAGRLNYQNLSQVNPSAPSVDGEPFADAATVATYSNPLLSGPLSMGKQLSAGQVYSRRYDSFGRLVWEVGRDLALGDTLYTRQLDYTRKGAIALDAMTFYETGGRAFKATRAFGYNARGQRTRRTTTLQHFQGSAITEPTDTLLYAYDATTGRLTSLTGKVGSAAYARAEFDYDVAGREIQRRTYLSGQGTPTLRRVWHHDPAGRRLADTTRAGSGSTVWSVFNQPSYNKVDELLQFTAREPGGGVYVHENQYDDLRRLTWTRKAVAGGVSWTNSWDYDQFGNRATHTRGTTVGGATCANAVDTLGYGPDNRLLFEDPDDYSGCTSYSHFLVDHTGNRLARIDSIGSGSVVQKSTYTALNQLYYSISPRDVASYDLNRHWYDAGGMRILSQVHWQDTWSQDWTLSEGTRTFYLYDGADVAMTVLSSEPGQYMVHQRFLSGGVDEPMAGRVKAGAGLQNLAIVTDYQGSTVAVVKSNGTKELSAVYVSREPFGGSLAGAAAAGGTNTETGYTGASTPNQRSGFTYLRNRWYDPQTGRFLTQDPIGLAGGTNLYAYANNNPTAFSDPFGLNPSCEPPDSPKCVRERIEGPVGDTDPGLADPTLLIGGLAGASRALVGRVFAREAAAAGESLLFEGGKEALRKALESGIQGVNSAQAAALRAALKEGSADLIKVVAGANGLVTYTTRAGRNGYQTLARVYDKSGELKRMAQAAWDAAGRFVHGEVWK